MKKRSLAIPQTDPASAFVVDRAKKVSQVKIQFNPKKLLQKVSQLIPVGFSVLFNILKVYQGSTPEKCFFFKMASKMAAETS